MVPSCAEGGVLGVLPGIVGSLQASEAIKVLTGIGDPLDGRLFLFDAASFSSRILKIPDTPGPAITELIDYEEFCGLAPSAPVKEIGVQEFFEMRERGVDFQLIDVREPYEVEIAELGGELIPPAEIERSADRIARDKMVVLHCRSGRRSADAVRLLEERFGFDNLYNLRGGILAWADEIDPSMAKY